MCVCLSLLLSTLLHPTGCAIFAQALERSLRLTKAVACVAVVRLHPQVYSHGLRVIMKGQPPQEWRAPGKKQIEKACANERQVVLALAGGEIIFFELDEAMQNIQASKSLSGPLTANALIHAAR